MVSPGAHRNAIDCRRPARPLLPEGVSSVGDGSEYGVHVTTRYDEPLPQHNARYGRTKGALTRFVKMLKLAV